MIGVCDINDALFRCTKSYSELMKRHAHTAKTDPKEAADGAELTQSYKHPQTSSSFQQQIQGSLSPVCSLMDRMSECAGTLAAMFI